MKYLVFDNENNLYARNNQIAKIKGCDKKPEDQTEYWFASIKHPIQDLWALCVDDESLLSDQEKLQLKSYDDLLVNGWFEHTV